MIWSLPEELRLDAHRIYTDKAYHALFSFELMSNITKNEEIRQHCQARSPAFLERLHKITNGEVPEKRAVWELFFAIVSEMLITSTLRDARDHPKIDNGIILMIDDHARDEARHHVFYKRIFEIVWPQLSRDNKELVVQSLPMLILAYTMPDESAIKSELLSIGLSCDQSEEIYSDTYSYEKISAYTKECRQGVYDAFSIISGINIKFRIDMSIPNKKFGEGVVCP